MQERKFDLPQVRALAGNISQEEAGALIGVSRLTFSKLEQHPGRLKLEQAQILAEKAKITIDQINF